MDAEGSRAVTAAPCAGFRLESASYLRRWFGIMGAGPSLG